jgi:hypothetical protein
MLATMLLSHASDGPAKVTWPWSDVDAESCWRQCYRVMLVMMLPRRHGHDAMYMPIHASDGAPKTCW